jgi:hypothetical protein
MKWRIAGFAKLGIDRTVVRSNEPLHCSSSTSLRNMANVTAGSLPRERIVNVGLGEGFVASSAPRRK